MFDLLPFSDLSRHKNLLDSGSLCKTTQQNKTLASISNPVPSIYPPTLLWQANGLQTYQEN